MDSIEVGFKSLNAASNLLVDGAIFFYHHNDVQIANEELDTLTPGSVNSNIDAQLFGAEIDLRWRPEMLPQAELNLGYAWIHARVASSERQIDPNNLLQGNPDFTVLFDHTNINQPYVVRTNDVLAVIDNVVDAGGAIGPDAAPGAQYPNGIPTWVSIAGLAAQGVAPVPAAELFDVLRVNLKGNHLAEVPEQTLHLGASYTWPLPIGFLTARWDYYWQDDFYTSVFNRRSSRVESWDRHSATLIFESPGGRWSIRAWIHNIEDRATITGGQRTEDLQVAVSEPRIYGASIRYVFGDRQ